MFVKRGQQIKLKKSTTQPAVCQTYEPSFIGSVVRKFLGLDVMDAKMQYLVDNGLIKDDLLVEGYSYLLLPYSHSLRLPQWLSLR